MTSKAISNGILKATFTIIFIILALLFLEKIQTVILYLIIALILTLIGNPFQKFLMNRLKFKNGLASITTIISFLLIIVGFIMLFVPLILSQSQSLSLLNTAEIEKNIRLLITNFGVFLESHNIDSKTLLKQSDLTSKINFNVVPNFLNSILGTISSFGIGLGSTLFITFFFLKDKNIFIEGLRIIIPDQHEEKIFNSIDKTNQMLSRYFIGILIQLVIVFLMYLIVLLIFGIDNAFIIAFLCGILNIIPYVGPLIGAIFAAILTMISNLGGDFQSETLPKSIYILISFIIVHLVDSNISQPIIFSKSVKSHPLEIFLVILISGFIFGITGMIIAIPLYTMLKVIGKEFLPENKIIQQITKNL
ncbi:MAG: AI-2E family transporter [Flavobacterium sp.]|nr:AI-2E family transporter [Flavobacterium sp.]